MAVALGFGLGVFLLYDWRTTPRRDRAAGPARRHRVREWLVAADYPQLSPAAFVGACASAALLGGLVGAALLGSVSIAVIAAGAGGAMPYVLVRTRARRRRRLLTRCWPEAIELLAGAVRAGDTLPAAIAVVADQGPDPLRPAFRSLVADHRVSGDLRGALDRLGIALADPISDRVVITLEVAYRVGGRELGRVLRTLAAFLREDQAVRQEIESRQSWTVVAARVAAAAPWLVLLLIASQPQARGAFDSIGGLVVLVAGAAATVAGYRLMLALGRLPEEPRVLGVRS
ncbi:MAG TPA: type II secretion system F family protein [Acidimicrobiia bacterium]|nr:type II secretion system F family protein [Acidimicrobiia bacterium]